MRLGARIGDALRRPDQIPNLLTGARIVLACVFPFVSSGVRIAVIASALVTEYLDGVLARRFEWETRLGRLLDPIADKLLFATVAGTFLVEGALSGLEFVAVGIRDLTIGLFAGWIAIRGRWNDFRRMSPGWSGKITTALQYVVFMLLVLGRAPPPALVALVGLSGVVASAQYFQRFLQERSRGPGG